MTFLSRPVVSIHYAAADRFTAEVVADRLDAAGYQSWLVPPEPAEERPHALAGPSGAPPAVRSGEVAATLASAEACILLLTPDAITSGVIDRDLARAETIGCPAVGLLVRSVEVSGALLDLPLVDARRDVESAFDALQRALEDLFPAAIADQARQRAEAARRTEDMLQAFDVVPGLRRVAERSLETTTVLPPPQVMRIITTDQDPAHALDRARAYLAQTGYQLAAPAKPGSVLEMARGSHWAAHATQSPKRVRTTVTLSHLGTTDDGHTRLRLHYEVSIPPGWGVTAQEVAYWDTELQGIEHALRGKRADDETRLLALGRALRHNLLGCMVLNWFMFGITLIVALLVLLPERELADTLAWLLAIVGVSLLTSGLHTLYGFWAGR